MNHSQKEALDTISYYDELITILHQDDEEFKVMDDIIEREEEIGKLREIREINIKNKIEAMLKTCIEEEDTMMYEAKKETSANLESIKEEIQSASHNSDNIQSQLDELQQRVSDVTKERGILAKQQQEIEHKITKGLPNARNDLQLYNHITGIKWETGSEAHEVKGYISSKKGLKTFSLNTLQNSQFFITNHLWDILEPDW